MQSSLMANNDSILDQTTAQKIMQKMNQSAANLNQNKRLEAPEPSEAKKTFGSFKQMKKEKQRVADDAQMQDDLNQFAQGTQELD